MRQTIKKILPRKLITSIGFMYTYHKLWNHSPRNGQLLQDGSGNYVPWMTYPSIEFLNNLDLSECSVFEYGSGSSTLFWSGKTNTVFSVERDRHWFEKIQPTLPANCQLIHQGNENLYAKEIGKTGKKYDIIVIDGAVRFPCLVESLGSLAQDGIIILDNLEWYPNTAQKLRELGFTQIDFSGFGPQNAYPSCTSLFFKSPRLLQKRLPKNHWSPVGGKFLMAHDDKPLEQIDQNLIITNG